MSWEDNIRKVVPYTPGEQPKNQNVIKLNTNENPYPPSPKVTEAMKAIKTEDFRLYPDPAASDLVHAIAKEYGLRDEEVFVGVGSDDVLAMCFMTFFNSKKPVFFPDITYSFYDVWADLLRIPYETKPLDENFRIVADDYLKPNGGIVFPNPNAPTGEILPTDQIEKIIAGNPDSIVIVDEAYVDFGAQSVLPLIHKYDNLIVTQTFSKARSLAGLRIGYAMANEKLIKYLNDVKYSFNSYTMNRPTIILGKACVEDTDYFHESCKKIMATREKTEAMLRELGFEFQDSLSNFVFVTHPKKAAKDIFEYLKSKHIFVRYFDKPRINNYLRITIGTDEEMAKLGEVLKEYLQ